MLQPVNKRRHIMDYDDEHNFTFRFESSDGKKRVEMNFDELLLGDILNSFRDFLQACGYEIDGQLEVVPFDDFEYGKAIQSGQQKVSEQPEFSFENIPNNNWPFSSTMNDTIPPAAKESVSYEMPGTIGGVTVTFK
jgi:hypothetical protein